LLQPTSQTASLCRGFAFAVLQHLPLRVRELIESVRCELLYLPPYSPGFSLIEEAFSKVKGLLREAEARTREALVEAMGRGSCCGYCARRKGFL
jgi:transposase